MTAAHIPSLFQYFIMFDLVSLFPKFLNVIEFIGCYDNEDEEKSCRRINIYPQQISKLVHKS